MKVIVGEAQEHYWEQARYRSHDHPVARAFAAPKLAYVEQYVDLRPATVLDVGCGNGLFTTLLAGRARSVVGADYSAFMLRANPAGRLVRARAEALPFATGSFDVAFVSNLLHHVPDPLSVVRELARLARRHVVLVEPNRANPLMFGFGLLVKEERGTLRSSRAHLAELLRSSGLTVVRCGAMGMISQNNTPQFLVPLLRAFDREIFFGEYIVAIGAVPGRA